MAHGVGEVVSESNSSVKRVNNNLLMRNHTNQPRKIVGVMGSRRIFAAAFKLKVLDSYRSDIECRGNQRATARKYGIHRRQIQKWLQCEKNLRSSCAESANRSGLIVVGKSLESAGSTGESNERNITNNQAISKSDEPPPPVLTTLSGGAPVAVASAVALNLSLARLHGDELTTPQGPSAHSLSHRSSPTSAPYTQHTLANILPIHSLMMGCTEYSGQDLHSHNQHPLAHHGLEDSAPMAIHGYKIDSSHSPPECKYDIVNHSTHDQSMTNYHGASDAQMMYLQSNRTSYLVNHTPCTYNCPINRNQQILQGNIYQSCNHISPLPAAAPLSISPPSSSSHSHLRDVDSPGNDSPAPAIKMERASPDSLATPVSCDEAPSSPDITTTTAVYPVNSHIYIPTSRIATQAVVARDIHFETPTRRTSSPGTQVHVCVDAHTSMYFTKKQHSRNLMYIKREDDESIMMEDELLDMCVPPKDNVGGQKESGSTRMEDRDTSICNIVAGVKYDSSPVPSLLQSQREIPSGSSSPARVSSCSDQLRPKGAAIIYCRSTSSCSDAEMDPMDYSSSSPQNPSGNMSRRRSFSLRFKLDVLDAFHGDAVVARNQRATARKFGINRRQVQKWLGQELELRDEIALRGGDLRQRLGSLQELPESAIDLRTGLNNRNDIETDSSSPLYCCDSSSHNFNYPSMSIESASAQNLCTSSLTSCYSESKRTCCSESQTSCYCYSSSDPMNASSIPGGFEINSSPSKQTVCTLSFCYGGPSAERSYIESRDVEWKKDSCEDQPLQEAPLCLVKEKYLSAPSPLQTERVTSTVRTPPTPAVFPPSSKKDAILFKPYLDNPISKPTDETPYYQQHNQSTPNSHKNLIVSNNNWSGICNLNDERGHDYAVELSLRVPVSWHAPSSHITEFSEPIPSAFAKYSATPHFI